MTPATAAVPTPSTSGSDPARDRSGNPVGPSRHRHLRIGVCVLFVVAVLPYLGLKAAWIGGSSIGATDPAILQDPFLWWANVATLALDAFAACLVWAMTFGRRPLPAWVLVVPMWVATGLLAPIVVAEPVALVVGLFRPAPSAATGAGLALAPWVYTVVYLGFVVQGLALAAAFALHANDRWPRVLNRLPYRSSGPIEAVLRPVLFLGVVLAAVGGILHVVMVATRVAGGGGFETWMPEIVHGLLAALAAYAAWWLAAGRGTHRSTGWNRAGVLVAWLGPAAMFAWGLWMSIAALSGTFAVQPLITGASLVKVLAGLVIGLSSLVLAAARSRATDTSTPG